MLEVTFFRKFGLRLVKFAVAALTSAALWAVGMTVAQAAPVTGVFSIDGVRLRSFPTIAPGSSITAGDFDGDEEPEVVAGSPPGVRAQVTVYALDGTVRERIYPYGSGMKAGITVAVGDVAGDGFPQIIVAPRRGAGPQVLLYGFDGRKLNSGIWAYGRRFSGGVSLAAGDLDGDGRDEIITGSGSGGGPHLSAFSHDGTRRWNFFPYELSFRQGITVAAMDLDGNGRDEVVVAPLQKRKADVAIVDLPAGAIRSTFRALGNFGGGASIAGLRLGSSMRIVAGAGSGGGPDVRQYDPATGLSAARSFFAFDRSWRGGVTVGAIDVNGDGQEEILAVPGATALSAAQLAAVGKAYVEPATSGVSYSLERVVASSGFFSVRIIRADLDAPNLTVKTVTATDGDCELDCPVHPLQYYVDQAGGFAGVNGSYFCPSSDASCGYRAGTYFWLWYNSLTGTFVNLEQNQFNTDPVLAFGGQNAPYWYAVSKDFHSKEAFEATTGMPLKALLSNGPMLVQDGKSVVRGSRLDAGQRTIKATRVGIGLKGRTLVIFAVSRATVLDLAHVAVALGLDAALNLDGGSSTALTFNNAYQAGPGRNVPNAIVLATQ